MLVLDSLGLAPAALVAGLFGSRPFSTLVREVTVHGLFSQSSTLVVGGYKMGRKPDGRSLLFLISGCNGNEK